MPRRKLPHSLRNVRVIGVGSSVSGAFKSTTVANACERHLAETERLVERTALESLPPGSRATLERRRTGESCNLCVAVILASRP